MEITTLSLSHTNLPKPVTTSSTSFSQPFFQSKHLPLVTSNIFHTKFQGVRIKARQGRNLGAVHAASESASPPAVVDTERWLLQPVGDGDWAHIGFKVPMPGAFEIASSVVTVGRVPEKADLVIPVATVSGLHARIQKKEGSLLVTDLESTNGTFIGEKRLKPGAIETALPGSVITFGDSNLAIFRVLKIENEQVKEEAEESEVKQETAGS